MEITRNLKVVPSTPAEATGAAESNPTKKAGTHLAAPKQDAELPLEQMQQSLRAMPDVDLDKVAALKKALQNGELSSDPTELAASMFEYHRGGSR